jgi:cytosine/adenosine deaminase-related metal-dependent hydrolase
MIIRAKYLVDRTFSVVENGALQIEDKRIIQVGRASDFRGQQTADLGDSLLLPGFVNAHTHLELGFTAGKIGPGPDFIDWLGCLVEQIRAQADHPEVFQESVEQGLAESLAAGTTLVGDITRMPTQTRLATARVTPRPAVVSFGEIIAFGSIRESGFNLISAACDDTHVGDDLGIGLSPHAPYSVEPDVLFDCLERARLENLPLSIHAAETQAEIQYTTRLTGPFRSYFERLGLWDDAIPCLGLRPIEHLYRCGALGPTTMLAHVNYANEDDLAMLRKTGSSVAYCPRAHAGFRHGPHRFREMLVQGVNVCLGTDSLASTPSLSVLDEMRFLRAGHADVPGRTILAMGTRNGAVALGHGTTRGTLEEGHRADVVSVALDPQGPGDAFENILCGRGECRTVIAAGACLIS